MTAHRTRPRVAGALLTYLLLCPVLLAASAASAATHVYRHPTLGFEITYPDGYATVEREIGVTVLTAGDYQAMQAAGTLNNPPSRGLDILFFDNSQGASPQDWAQQNDGSSHWSSRQNGRSDIIQFAGQRALIYTWCAPGCGDALVFNRGDGRNVIYINTAYTDPRDPARADFKRIASSIRLPRPGVVTPPRAGPPQPPGGSGGGHPVRGNYGIAIVSATFGGACGAQPGNWSGYVATECNGRDRCDFLVDSRYGDPVQGCFKDFDVRWSCGNDPTIRRAGHPPQQGENYQVTLTCDVASPPPPGPQSGPAPGEAWLYEDCNFGGRVKRLNADMPWLGNDFNDVLSSVRLGPGTAITLFEDGNFGGRSLTLNQDEACLANQGFNDRASSARLQSGPPVQPPPSGGPGPGEVWLYEDCGFGGRVLRLNAETPELSEEFSGMLSAVRLGPGTTVTLYEDERFHGRSLTLDRDEACLDNRNFNDIASSVRIRGSSSGGPGGRPEPGEVWLYEDCNFGGRVKRVSEDMPYIDDDFDDVISSVRLGPDTRVTLFEDNDYEGRSIKLERDEACLTRRHFNDRASSLRVRGRHRR